MTNDKIFILIASVWCVSVEAIGGGDYISITDVPYYAALDDLYYKLILNKIFCGGAILSEQWIITAAHCSGGGPLLQMRVRTGETTQTGEGIVRNVTKVLIHPDYEFIINSRKESIVNNDIALLKLETPISFDNYQQPIAIKNDSLKIDDIVTIVGLGRDSMTTTSASLKKVYMMIVPMSDVDARLLPKTMILSANRFSGACPGDSGSPVVDVNGKLVGILSMGFGCRYWFDRQVIKHNLITPIYPYIDWISKQTGLSWD